MKLTPLLAAAAALAVGTTLTAAPATADRTAPDPSSPASRPAPSSIPLLADPTDRAQAVLERVEDLFADGATGGPTDVSGTGPSDLTSALRQLSLLREELPAAQQEEAARYFARPTDPNTDRCPDVRCYTGKAKRTCSEVVCVHWVPKQRDRRNGVPAADRDDDGIPNYVERTEKEMTHVHETYVASGWQPPLPDGKRGGNAKPDVYLAQIGDRGLYGYCTSDDPHPPTVGGTWGYCVLDNDYAREEFGVHTPIENLQVTAAHEYLHNVQFGYDYGEDDWFYEATATWAEDVLYDDVNDNAYYLSYGPIRDLTTPLDTFTGLFHYGAWIFFRYLTDRYGDTQGEMPDLVLRMWEEAVGPAKEGHYSLAAVRKVLAEEGTDLADEYAGFASGNRRPELTYAEEYAEVAADPDDKVRYPRSPLQATFELDELDSVERSFELDHLTPRTFRFKPAAGLAGRDLHLAFDVLDPQYGGRVVVTLKQGGADPVSELVDLAADGTGSWTRPFPAGSVDWVEVTVVNGSDRMRCNRGIFSCDGRALDDNAEQLLSAEIRPVA